MQKSNIFFSALVLILAVLSFYFYDNSTKEIKEVSFVTSVVDGDTIVISGGERVRLLGIDTPEKGEFIYKEAKVRVESLIEQKEIFLLKEGEDKDLYDRLLRWIFLNDTNINLLLIQEGLARCYFYRESKYQPECAKLEKNAIENKIGLWSNSSNS